MLWITSLKRLNLKLYKPKTATSFTNMTAFTIYYFYLPNLDGTRHRRELAGELSGSGGIIIQKVLLL